jgi:Tfp pilus assembly protein PilF
MGGILILGLLAYLPSLSYPYLQDSVAAVEHNPVVERGDLVEIFRSHYWKDTVSNARTLYRPVTVLSFALERRVAGEPSPGLSHLVNMLLHLINAALLFLYCRRLGAAAWFALFAAWLFTVHPLLLQGVINVAGRADLLATLFSLAALLAFTTTRTRSGSQLMTAGRLRLASWSTGLFLFLALCSKEIALVTLPLLLAQEFLVRERENIPRARESWIHRSTALAPCVLAMLLFIHLRTLAIGEFPGMQIIPPEDNVLVGLDGLSRWSTALAMAARYAGLLLFPAKLSPDYSGTVIQVHDSPFQPLPMLGFLFLAAMAILAWSPWHKRQAPVSVGGWLFLLPYLLVGNLFVLNAAGFAERLLYLPAAGFCIVVAWLLWLAMRCLPRLKWLVPAAAALLLAAGVLQVRTEGRMWESHSSLFDQALKNTPRSLRANMVQAHWHRRNGEAQEALRRFELCVEYSPTDAGGWSDLAIFLVEQGQLQRAEEALHRALELDPTSGAAHAYLGLVLRRYGRSAEAERSLRKALRWRPDMTLPAAELGHLLFDAGRYREAAHYYGGCVRLGREDLVDDLQRAQSMARRQR